MSDERKEFAWLDVLINSMERAQGNYYAFYMGKDDVDKLKQLYESLTQPKPEIDEGYVKEMAEELLEIARYGRIPVFNNKVAERFITQIISDAKRGEE